MAKDNIIINGVPVSGGVAMGEAQVLRDPMFQIVRRTIPAARIKSETARLEEASQKAIEELRIAKFKAIKAVGEQGASVFEAQVMIASDRQFLDSVIEKITVERVNAEYAFQEALAVTINRLNDSQDQSLRHMIHDIRSVSERVLSFMMGIGDGHENGFDRPTILIGRIFSPGQIMSYAKRNVVGFLTEEGGPTSHMGLIVRSLGLPAVMGDYSIGDDITSGTQIIIDGNNGEVIINPDPNTWRNYRRIRLRKRSQPFALLLKSRSISPVCSDGRKIKLAANLEVPGSLDEHLVRLGIGVGLYRTEFLYFSKQSFPDEEEQYDVYYGIARKFNPLPVTLRTFDLGGDKYAKELGRISEDNPALGWRGIRVSLESPKMFRTQLRAMLRASVLGNLKILLPMVSDVEELIATLDFIEKTKRELKRAHIDYDDNVPVGVMIEVPSAAMSADYLAEKADFFSIGTNDLIQYTMAADRGNHRVAKYYIGHHPAVLQLIVRTIHAAHQNGIPVSICGEMASSKTMAPFLVGLGVDELSMSPTQLPVIADWISRFKYIDAKRFSSRVMRLGNAEKVSRALKEAYDYIKQQRKGSWLDEQTRRR
ncbi:MAG: phosphoenolpyruvate--protein phosphotransferase [FCB group bacterium]|nr:phosphoenolpyruvate--protein phosphotransferase [FCB group bacterium]